MGAPFRQYGNKHNSASVLLCTALLRFTLNWTAVRLSAALLWHLGATHPRKTKPRRLPWHVGLFECVTERLSPLAVIWNWECAFSSMAPSSSSGSSRRMPGNTPAVRATALVSRPRHRPTWLFSVSVTVATKWRGRGGGDVTAVVWGEQQQQYGGCCTVSQRGSNALMQRNLLEFQGQTWQESTWSLLDHLYTQMFLLTQLSPISTAASLLCTKMEVACPQAPFPPDSSEPGCT